MNRHLSTTTAVLFIVLLFSCTERNQPMLAKEINAINLKTGDVILCGPDDKGVGKFLFIISADNSLTKQFNFAIALLHSFEYDEAEKVFAKIIQYNEHCAMAYWGVAMCNFHPLWTPPETPELTKGQKALEIAKSIEPKTPREADYINALLAYYNNWEKLDHRTRCNQYEAAMRSLSEKYPNDKEATIFYALAIDAAADPADKKYASVASASAHAQHMPSHIFTRLGMWDESIQSNLASMSAAKCYAENSGI